MPQEEMDTPIPTTHKYVGFNLSVSKRLQEHEKEDTSWFQYLVQDALRLEMRDDGYFHSETYAVCFLCKDEAPIAEVVIGAITDCSTETGKGLSVYQREVRRTSSLLGKLDEPVKKQIWQACCEWRSRHTPYDDNASGEVRVLRNPPAQNPESLLAREQQRLKEVQEKSRRLHAMLDEAAEEENRFLARLDGLGRPQRFRRR